MLAIQKYKNKEIAIYGMGITGRSAAKTFKNMGAKEISRALFLHLLKKSTSEKGQFDILCSKVINKKLIKKDVRTKIQQTIYNSIIYHSI